MTMTTVRLDSATEIDLAIRDAIRAGLEDIAIRVESTAKRLVHSGGGGKTYLKGFVYRKHGKLYAVPGRTTAHTAGVAGGPPSSDSGRLVGSIGHSIEDYGDSIRAKISATVYYSGYVELGTSISDGPHPFLRPALYAEAG